jgi:FKBP-type peptidyl-prolyl cis-trans isomerase FkpA
MLSTKNSELLDLFMELLVFLLKSAKRFLQELFVKSSKSVFPVTPAARFPAYRPSPAPGFHFSRYLPLLILLLAVSCKQVPEPQRNFSNESLKEPLIRANIMAKDTEEDDINSFIERYEWKMRTTGTGIRYMIYHNGNGPRAEEGKIASLNYTLRLISGEVVYSSEEGGAMEFLIGKGGVESGLEEAILLLRQGDKARIIIPSQLGFGLAGDDHKIPPKATLIYDIELFNIH